MICSSSLGLSGAVGGRGIGMGSRLYHSFEFAATRLKSRVWCEFDTLSFITHPGKATPRLHPASNFPRAEFRRYGSIFEVLASFVYGLLQGGVGNEGRAGRPHN